MAARSVPKAAAGDLARAARQHDRAPLSPDARALGWIANVAASPDPKPRVAALPASPLGSGRRSQVSMLVGRCNCFKPRSSPLPNFDANSDFKPRTARSLRGMYGPAVSIASVPAATS